MDSRVNSKALGISFGHCRRISTRGKRESGRAACSEDAIGHAINHVIENRACSLLP